MKNYSSVTRDVGGTHLINPTNRQRLLMAGAPLTGRSLKRVFRWETILILAAGLLLNPAARAQSGSPTNDTFGLVAWWPLDETSGPNLVDLTGNGNTATLVGSPASISGVITNAWLFNGSSQYATVPYSATYDVSTFTLMCWINTTASGGTILSRNPFGVWEFSLNEGRTDAVNAPGLPSFCNGSSWVSAKSTVNDGIWRHVAVVVSAGTTYFYINGQLDSSRPQPAPPMDPSSGIYLAARNNSGGVCLAGSLDDVRIYNRALSAGEIANQYQWRSGASPITNISPLANLPPGVKTYYIDYSTGSDTNNGLSTNAPWQHHPYMIGWKGKFTHARGDQFIFRGGVTWPSTCFPLDTYVGGASNAPDYYGVSPSYYAGPSWTKPVWDDNGTPLNTMTDASFVKIYWGASCITFDSIVFTNLNWNADVGVNAISMGESTNVVVTNCEFGNFIYTPPGADDLTCVSSWAGTNLPGNKVSHCLFSGLPSSANVGQAVFCCETFEYNTVSFMPNGFSGFCTTNQYNVVHDIQLSLNHGAVHENALYQFIPQGVVSYTRGNTISNCAGGMLLFNALLGINAGGQTFTNYIYNNLVANNFSVVPCITLDPYHSTNQSGCVFCVFNNTIQDSERPGGWAFIRVIARAANSSVGAVYAGNNFFISDNLARSGLLPDASSVAAVFEANELTYNNAAAIAAGYTQANSWQPTSPNSPTVGRGSDTPSTIFTNDILNQPRSSGAWDIGAYQFVNPTAPAPISH